MRTERWRSATSEEERKNVDDVGDVHLAVVVDVEHDQVAGLLQASQRILSHNSTILTDEDTL